MFELSDSSMAQMHPTLVIGAMVCAALAAAILVWYLARRPPLDWTTRLMLLAGLGIFPIGTAMMGNAANLAHTQKRAFCGSCHVMAPYEQDSVDPTSASLASRHARNRFFGDENCYSCHQDYGMFGLVYTKIGGLKHVWYYYTEYQYYSLEEAKEKIHIAQPFTNRNCTTCHSMQAQDWMERSDHRQLLDDLKSSKVSCLGNGCHGPAHPFSKPAEALKPEGGAP